MPVWKTFHKLFLGSTLRLICCIPSITRANPNPLWSFSETRETMSHLKSSRFCLCGHETLADEVGVGIGANQVESLLEVRKFVLPVRDRHLIWIEMFKHISYHIEILWKYCKYENKTLSFRGGQGIWLRLVSIRESCSGRSSSCEKQKKKVHFWLTRYLGGV